MYDNEPAAPATTAGIVFGLFIAFAIVSVFGGCAMSTREPCPDLEPTCEVDTFEIDVACFAAGTSNRLARQRADELGCEACLPVLYADDMDSRRPIDGLVVWDEYRRLLDAQTCAELTERPGAW